MKTSHVKCDGCQIEVTVESSNQTPPNWLTVSAGRLVEEPMPDPMEGMEEDIVESTKELEPGHRGQMRNAMHAQLKLQRRRMRRMPKAPGAFTRYQQGSIDLCPKCVSEGKIDAVLRMVLEDTGAATFSPLAGVGSPL